MDTTILSAIVLTILFVGSFHSKFSIALAAFPATYLIATLAGVSLDEVAGFFPADLVILVVGITALFIVVDLTGTMDWILERSLQLIGGRLSLVPILIFAIGALITAAGTLPIASLAIMAPVALGISTRYRISHFLMSVIMYNGIIAGMFSPIAVYGAMMPRLASRTGIVLPGHATVAILAAVTGVSIVVAAAAMVFVVRAPRKPNSDKGTPSVAACGTPFPTGRSAPATTTDGGHGVATATLVRESTTSVTTRLPPGPVVRWACVTALAALVVAGVGFGLDIGYVGITLALILQLAFRIEPGKIIERIPWSIVILISGILTYVGLMQHLDAFSRISHGLMGIGSPTVSLLMICLVVGVTSFFASSVAVLAASVPLLPPLIASGVPALGAVIAVAVSAVVVDVNPLGPAGGLMLSASPKPVRDFLFRKLLLFGIGATALGPVAGWLVSAVL